MEQEAIARLYDRIVSGCKIIQDRGQLYVVRDPSSFVRQLAYTKYDATYDQYVLSGTPNLAGVAELLIKRGLWGANSDKLLDKLKNEKIALGKQIREAEFKSNTKKTLEKRLVEVANKLKKLNRQKHYLSNISAEYFAKIEYYRTLVYLLTFDLDGNRIWTNLENFAAADDSLISLLIKEAYLNEDIGESEIRLLARSEPWRSSWLTAVKTGRLLIGPASEMTELQRAAAQWSIIYDNAFESSEPPSPDVLANDDLFDQWLEAQSDKRRKGTKEVDKYKNMTGEIGIVVETPEDAQKVYSMNDAATQHKLKERFQAVSEKGKLGEGQLPDVRRELQMQINRNAANVKR